MPGSEFVIPAPPLRKRPYGLLLDEAVEIDDSSRPGGWRAGVTFSPMGCTGLTETDAAFCTPTGNPDYFTESLDPTDTANCPVFEAFEISAQESVSAMRFDSAFIEGRMEERWRAYISDAVARHLYNDATKSFGTDAVIRTSGTGVDAALLMSTLEAHLADVLHGAQGMIHLSPAALAAIKGGLNLSDGSWFSPGGHIIVADSGQQDTAPAGQAGAANGGWAYASGLVTYKVGEPQFRTPSANEYLDRTDNTIRARRVAQAVVAYEPCAVGAAKFKFPASV